MFSWIVEHWSGLLENVGIISGLVFTGLAIRRDSRVRRAETLLKITEQHRSLWMDFDDRPELSSLLDFDRDLESSPLKKEEVRFVRYCIQHLRATFYAAKAGIFIQPEALGADIAAFFAKPGPRAVWESSKHWHDRTFVDFVESYLSKKS